MYRWSLQYQEELLPYAERLDTRKHAIGVHIRSMQADGVISGSASSESEELPCENNKTDNIEYCWQIKVEAEYRKVLQGKIHRDRCNVLDRLYAGKLLTVLQCGQNLTSLLDNSIETYVPYGARENTISTHTESALFLASLAATTFDPSVLIAVDIEEEKLALASDFGALHQNVEKLRYLSFTSME